MNAARPRRPADQAAAGAPADTDAYVLPPRKILLAEDGKANRIMAVGLLTKWGHEVAVASNGQEAVDLWRQGDFDVILMDVQMPVMDGFQATQRIRELEQGQGRRTPIVAMTARAMKGDREKCLAAGMDDYVSKPVRKADLHRALSGLGRPAAAAAASNGGPGPANAVVNWESALEAVGGDRSLLHDIVDVTLEEMPGLVRQLEDAIREQDAKTTQRLAHTIKGGATTLTAATTQQAAAAVEDSAAKCNLELAASQLPKLAQAIDELIRHCGDFKQAR